MPHTRCLLLLVALSGCYDGSSMGMQEAGVAVENPGVAVEDAGVYGEMLAYCAKFPARRDSDSGACSKSSLEAWCAVSKEQNRDCPRTFDEARDYVCGETGRSYEIECNTCGGLNVTRTVGIDGIIYLSFDAGGQLVGAAVSENGQAEHCDDALLGVAGTWCPAADLEHPSSQLACASRTSQ